MSQEIWAELMAISSVKEKSSVKTNGFEKNVQVTSEMSTSSVKISKLRSQNAGAMSVFSKFSNARGWAENIFRFYQ